MMAIRIIDGIEYEEIYWKDFYTNSIAITYSDDIGKENYIFERKIFIGNFEFLYFRNTAVYLEDCFFEDEVHFAHVEYKRFITFRRCTFEKRIDFGSAMFKSKVGFIDGYCNDHFFISGATFENLVINMYCNEISITRAKFNSLSIHGHSSNKLLKLDKLNINFDHIKGFLSFKNLELGVASLTGTVDKDAELLMSEILFAKISISTLFNNGKIRLFNLAPNELPESYGTIFMLGSNLGKTDFFNVNITSVTDLVISNCYFIDCTFVNVLWPKNLNIFALPGLDTNWLDIKEMYRQLKYAYSKQGDTVQEHRFHALEMTAYETYLRNERKQAKHLKFWKRLFLHFENRVILYLSRKTSDFGQSFIRPLVTLLALNAVLFLFLVKTGGVDSLVFKFNFSGHQIIATIGEALAFANPLRKFEGSHSGWPIIIDLAMRIISSYCLYNIIRATRRFVK